MPLKSVRSLEIGASHLHLEKFDDKTDEELIGYISEFRDDNIFAMTELLRRGISVEKLHQVTMITPYFIEAVKHVTDMEKALASAPGDAEMLRKAKAMGFSDRYIAKLWDMKEMDIYRQRQELDIRPSYRMVDTFHTGAYIPYFYSSYSGENDSQLSDKKKNRSTWRRPYKDRPGSRVDYSTVHAVMTIRQAGYEAIIINNNPETVSTDYTTGDKLYFEPLTAEDVMNIIDFEQPEGVIASLGGTDGHQPG